MRRSSVPTRTMWTRASYLCNELSIICVWNNFAKKLNGCTQISFEGPIISLSFFYRFFTPLSITWWRITSIKWQRGKRRISSLIERGRREWKSASGTYGRRGLIDLCRLRIESTNRRRDRPVWEDVFRDVPTLDHGRRRSKVSKVTKYQGSHQTTFRIQPKTHPFYSFSLVLSLNKLETNLFSFLCAWEPK
jgi:hypothetical protein